MWKGNDKPISVKGFYLIIRMVEAEIILKASDFKNLEAKRNVITDDILKGLITQSDCKIKQAKQIAGVYLKDYPFLKAIQTYDKQDLALALANHYHPVLLELDILHLTEMTGFEAVAVASALLKDFDPTSKRMDGTDSLGEFIKYQGKPGLFYNAIETRRAFQYQTFFNVAFDSTDRFKLLNLDKPLIQPSQVDTALQEPTPEHSHAGTEIELETVECEPLDSDNFYSDDGIEENNIDTDDQSYLDGALPDDIHDGDFVDVDENDEDYNNYS
jgi:hypothetical protein